MKAGAVVLDMAAESGGNVEGSVPGETVEVGGVKLIGARNLPARIAPATTVLYAKNLLNFVQLLVDPKSQELKIDTDDELIKGTLLTMGGAGRPRRLQARGLRGAEMEAIDPGIYDLIIFFLAVFVGYYVVWSVTPALHTPLMSVTNAISSVIIVGALLATGAGGAAAVFGFLAVVLASVNIFGGFAVTERMLAMFKKRG